MKCLAIYSPKDNSVLKYFHFAAQDQLLTSCALNLSSLVSGEWFNKIPKVYPYYYSNLGKQILSSYRYDTM